MRIIAETDRRVDICGINNHQLDDLKIASAGGVTKSNHGEIVVIVHQGAIMPGQDRSILSSPQLESHKIEVDDRAVKVGGKQKIITLDGYHIPLDFHNGLPYMAIRPFTDQEYDTLPHVFLTQDLDWDPAILDTKISDNDEWYDAIEDEEELPRHSNFDEIGNFHQREVNRCMIQLRDQLIEDELVDKDDPCFRDEQGDYFDSFDGQYYLDPWENDPNIYTKVTSWGQYCIDGNDTFHDAFDPDDPKCKAMEHEMHKKEPDYTKFIPHLLMATADRVKKTFECTTRFARKGLHPRSHMQKFFRTPCPAANVRRRNEDVATDTIKGPVVAVGGGFKMAQFFCGMKTYYASLYGVKLDKQYVNTLEDEIRKNGAMNRVVSD